MHSNSQETILILGASARYIAQSAKIAGLQPLAVDLFADWDLQKIAAVRQVAGLSKINATDLESFASKASGFLIAGGMEIRTDVIERAKAVVTFMGPKISQISRTQDPFVISSFCQSHHISFPAIRDWQNLPDGEATKWLLKPLLGSGGHAIRKWSWDEPVSAQQFLQRQITGTSHSALFAHNGSKTKLLGTTRQLVGQQPYSDCDFTYCGSVGPVRLSATSRNQITKIGGFVANAFELTGCFGIDFLVDINDEVWLIEINPRITASAEVLELAGCLESVVKVHMDASRNRSLPQANEFDLIVGKAIVYSSHSIAFSISSQLFAQLIVRSIYHRTKKEPNIARFAVADIPVAGTVIEPGHPIVTVFCHGSSIEQVMSELNVAANAINEQIKKLTDVLAVS